MACGLPIIGHTIARSYLFYVQVLDYQPACEQIPGLHCKQTFVVGGVRFRHYFEECSFTTCNIKTL
jgi:hypothetical protein